MTVKLVGNTDYKEVIYSDMQWAKLKVLREKSISIMAILEAAHLGSTIHGSVARGDVNEKSDIDIFIAEVQNSFLVETALEKEKVPVNSRWIVQATPNYAMKAHIEVDEITTVTFPLMNMRRVEREFYRFGGEADLKQLRSSIRLIGVDKRLMLIEPTQQGHIESSIVGREEYTANLLRISVETVLDRVHAIMRRNSIGRTGIFIKKELRSDCTFELELKKLVEENPAVRRRWKA